MAVNEGNNMSIDILLTYMAKIGLNCSFTYKDIFHKLMSYKYIKNYITSLPITTPQMEKKQVLKVKSTFSDEIIQMAESNTIYVD